MNDRRCSLVTPRGARAGVATGRPYPWAAQVLVLVLVGLFAADAVRAVFGSTVGPWVNPVVHEGTDAEETVRGGLDDDFLDGGGGADRALGFSGRDELDGGGGNDELFGGGGNDFLHGDGAGFELPRRYVGDDALFGGAGGDYLSGDTGRDRISAGEGDDVVVADDGERDRVSCGPGHDAYRADGIDEVSADCEERRDWPRLTGSFGNRGARTPVGDG